MVKLGVVITAATVALLVAETLRQRRAALPVHGWMGIAALVSAEWLLFRGVEPVATYFTPIAWTAYILIADAATFALAGRSRLTTAPGRLARTALLSIPLWMIFEAYNLRLANWAYTGLPERLAARWLGYGWSFATIIPAIFLTADWLRALGLGAAPRRPVKFSSAAQRVMIVAGALCLLVPLVLPQRIGAYLFAPVWLGFALLLDPLNFRLGLPSLTGDLAAGRRDRFYSLLAAGWVCGWLWEFWNWWAAARWEYVFPMFQQWKIFAMPAPGYLGFPPFALECFAMYVTAAAALGWLKPQAARGESDRQLEI